MPKARAKLMCAARLVMMSASAACTAVENEIWPRWCAVRDKGARGKAAGPIACVVGGTRGTYALAEQAYETLGGGIDGARCLEVCVSCTGLYTVYILQL